MDSERIPGEWTYRHERPAMLMLFLIRGTALGLPGRLVILYQDVTDLAGEITAAVTARGLLEPRRLTANGRHAVGRYVGFTTSLDPFMDTQDRVLELRGPAKIAVTSRKDPSELPARPGSHATVA
jgi:hypothetical protein